MSFRRWLPWSSLAILLACSSLSPVAAQSQDRDFQIAVTQYNAGKFAEAAERLQKLERQMPQSFEVQELLGLSYTALSQDEQATGHLQKAVHLKPGLAAARTSLATNLVRLGRLPAAEIEFKKAVALAPRAFETNHNLGEFYIRAEKVAQAVPYLQVAQRINPAAYDNGYDLALALLQTGQTKQAGTLIRSLLKQRDTAELHNLLGQIEEREGNSVAAANEFEAAAHREPSESNLFDWGSELLLHRTLEPAIAVFQEASKRYPDSARLTIGLGVALYSHGNYDEAVQSLLRGADLNPRDARCYYFLSRAYDSSPAQAEEVIQRFRRFTELEPANGRALYYYAMSVWKGRRAQDPDLDLSQIESLLKKAVALDSQIAEAHLQLGNLYFDQTKYADAIPEYERARQLNPDLADAYYRLGQAYVRTGSKERGQELLEAYQKIRQQHLADLDKQRADIRQFVYAEKDSPAGKQ